MHVESKGLSITLHYRGRPRLEPRGARVRRVAGDPVRARSAGRRRCRSSCTRPSRPTRAPRCVELSEGLSAVAFIGDDVGDLPRLRRPRSPGGRRRAHRARGGAQRGGVRRAHLDAPTSCVDGSAACAISCSTWPSTHAAPDRQSAAASWSASQSSRSACRRSAAQSGGLRSDDRRAMSSAPGAHRDPRWRRRRTG